jgi:hypothetical protein
MYGLKPVPFAGPKAFSSRAERSVVSGGGDFVGPAGGFEEFAGAGAVGGADQTVALDEVDEALPGAQTTRWQQPRPRLPEKVRVKDGAPSFAGWVKGGVSGALERHQI